jgi:hypothetical protein
VQNQQRYLFESILLSLHLKGRCENLQVFNSLKEKIPFRKNFNVRLGIVIKDILQSGAGEIDIHALGVKYGGFQNIQNDLQRGLALWRQLNDVVQMR